MTQLSHDHEILVDSTITKLRLAKDQSGKTLYEVQELVPEYRQALELGQTDWTHGHGQYEVQDPQAYFDGQSIDTTQEGRVILGPEINEVYIYAPSDPTYIDLRPNAVGDETNIPVQYPGSGDHYDKVDDTTSDGDATYVSAYQDYPNYGSHRDLYNLTTSGSLGTITNLAVYAVCRKYDDAYYNVMKLHIKTGGTVYSSSNIVLTSSYAEYSESWATNPATGNPWAWSDLDALQAGITLNMTRHGTGGYGFEYGICTMLYVRVSYDPTIPTSPELDSAPVVFLWAASLNNALCATGGKIYFYTTAGWQAATTTVAGVTDLKEFNGVVYAAVGAATKYYYSTNGSTWTQTDLTDGYANKFLVAPNAAGTQNVLWKTKNPNQLSSTTDGRTVAAGGIQWSSPAYIGDTTSNITTPFLLNDELYIGRVDQLYTYDNSGGIHALMDELKSARSTANFKYVQNWQSGAYFSRGVQIGELIGASPGVFDIMGPLAETGDIDKVGTVVGIAADATHLYVAMLEGSATHIYKGKPTSEGSWAWCPWVYLGTNNCAVIYVAQHGTTDRRLWFGYGTHTGYVQITENPTTDTQARFAASGFVRMSYLYGSNPYWDKMFQTIVTETVGCTSGQTVQPKYRQDSETSMTNLTSAITTNGVVSTTLTSSLAAKRIQFELDLTTDNSLLTPQVLTFIAKGVEKPEVRRVHNCTYYAGNKRTQAAATVRSALRDARLSTSLIKLADLRWGGPMPKGTSGVQDVDWAYVVMPPGYPREVELVAEKDREPELGLEARWQEVLGLTAGAGGGSTNLSLQVTAVEFVIDGNGSEIATGQKGHVYIPFAGTITQGSIAADQTGSIVVDVWKDTTANFPPTDADSITASTPLTIAANDLVTDSLLTGWTTAVSAGDWLAFNVDSCSTITRATVALKITRI